MLKFAIVLLCAGVCCATKCCFPMQWEAIEGMLTGSVDDEGHAAVTQGLLKVAYDATGQRIRLDESVSTGNITRTFVILMLYQQSTMFIIQNNTCSRSKLPAWGTQGCIPVWDCLGVAGGVDVRILQASVIPMRQKQSVIIQLSENKKKALNGLLDKVYPLDNATLVSRYRIGQSPSLNVADYTWNTGPQQVVITVTDGCVPVAEKLYGNLNGVNVMTGVGFQGITPGIKDPTIFTVPDICKGIPEAGVDESHRVRRGIFIR